MFDKLKRWLAAWWPADAVTESVFDEIADLRSSLPIWVQANEPHQLHLRVNAYMPTVINETRRLRAINALLQENRFVTAVLYSEGITPMYLADWLSAKDDVLINYLGDYLDEVNLFFHHYHTRPTDGTDANTRVWFVLQDQLANRIAELKRLCQQLQDRSVA